MATAFVFSPVPRFYQLAAKTRIPAFAHHLYDSAMREEFVWFANDRLSSQPEDQSTRTTIEPPSSPFQPAFSDLFSSWIQSAGPQRLYTASLCCSGDEVIETSKTGRHTRSAGPIAPPRDHCSNFQNPKVATSAKRFIAPDTLVFPASNPTVKDLKFANGSKDDCSNWLNLTSYKRPLMSSNLALNTEIVPEDRLTPPPGSQSRLARILNVQNRDQGSTALPPSFNDTSPEKI